ncbi:MAG: ASPIC/UnbV domain-containing protein [Acidobacteriaceae bacterium]
MILAPQGGPPNHWISLQLEGTKSNRLALNARVTTTAGELVQTGEVLSGGSYLSQNDLRIHFGLGSHDRADKLEIHWPDGTKQTFTNVSADHLYQVTEGKDIVRECDMVHSFVCYWISKTICAESTVDGVLVRSLSAMYCSTSD